MARRHDIRDELRRGPVDGPEVMLGLLLLGTSFVTGLFVGWAIG